MAEGYGNGVGSSAVEFTTIIDIPSKLSSRVHPVTSVVPSQSRDDATYSMPVESERSPPHIEKAAAFRGGEDSRCV